MFTTIKNLGKNIILKSIIYSKHYFSDDQTDIDTDQRDYEPSNLPPTSKSSTLRGWLEDSWLRPPAAVLVPLRPMALNRALAVWKDVTVENLNVSDIVIVGYDSNGKDFCNLYSQFHIDYS